MFKRVEASRENKEGEKLPLATSIAQTKKETRIKESEPDSRFNPSRRVVGTVSTPKRREKQEPG